MVARHRPGSLHHQWWPPKARRLRRGSRASRAHVRRRRTAAALVRRIDHRDGRPPLAAPTTAPFAGYAAAGKSNDDALRQPRSKYGTPFRGQIDQMGALPPYPRDI